MRLAAGQRRAQSRVVAARVMVRGDAHGPRERGEDLPVRSRLALGRDHRLRILEIEVAERAVQVRMLHRGRGRQHEVRVVCRVGHHLLVHHREEVLAGEPAQHQRLVRADGGGIRRVDVERLHRRSHVRVGQRAAEPDHVDHARRRRRHEVGTLERAQVQRKRTAGRQQRTTVRIGVGARQRRQARDGAAGHAAVVVP